MSRSIIRRKRKRPQDTIKSICKKCNHDKARKFENSFIINGFKFNINFFDTDFHFDLNKITTEIYMENNNVLSNQVKGVTRYLVGGKRKIKRINLLGFTKEQLKYCKEQYPFEINHKTTANFIHFIFDTNEELFIDSSDNIFSVSILKEKSRIETIIKDLDLAVEYSIQ